MSRSYCPPDGQIVQAFTFALDPTVEQKRQISRFFGARRFAFNWTLARIRTDLEHDHETGESSTPPSFYSLRKRWNAEKDTVCVNDTTGEVWWPEVAKEVFADGVRGATDAYWRWQKSRSGALKGRKVGFPRFKKRGKDRDRFSFSTGTETMDSGRSSLACARVSREHLAVLGFMNTANTG